MGLSFSIPIETAERTIKQLREHGKVSRGLMGVQVGAVTREMAEAFGLERMLILQFEQCLQDPAGEYQRTLEFLELPAWVPPPEVLGKAYNVSTRRPSPAALDEPPDLVESLEGDVRELLTFAPDIDLSLWPNFRHLAR